MGEKKMTVVKRTFSISNESQGRSILVEFVKDTNDKWFWIYRDTPVTSDFSGGAGGNKHKSLKKTVQDFAEQADYMDKGWLQGWRKEHDKMLEKFK